MTATTTDARGGRVAALRRGWRRGRRVFIPFGVVALLLVVTLVAHAVDTPDTGDTDFLSPASDAPIGSARLAEVVRNRGVEVIRHTDPRAALADADGATLFVPAAEFLDPQTLNAIDSLSPYTRVVLVDPPARALRGIGAPLARGQRRWATQSVSSGGCAIPGIVETGDAAARRQAYGFDPAFGGQRDACYASGVVRLTSPTELVVVGAADAFRNDRGDEHDNRAFAAGLLATRTRLVWLDLHERYEPPKPPVTDSPDPTADETYEWDDGGGDPGDSGRPQGGAPGSDDGGERPSDAAGNPLGDAFPPWLWAMLATFAGALLLLLLWSGRRLGPAVSEPLPVEVRSGETVLGRGRLYQRAKARGPVADVLRQAALRRIEPALGLEPEHTRPEVVAAVAQRTGRDADQVDRLLYGPEPTHDDDLLDLARGLDAVADEVGGVPSRDTQPGSTGPDQGEAR
ncbi:DUF4350 domain-containing protein [Asanoa iriomotensis]|uniref:Membrane protein n=1 Tax=Asanoa iriomotensis TaxID=234613 RepID=A0ABQ4CA10_9ACTN|nr:DUF4350 domain-containing protein [Asanoa iriomotensis]GIF59615.1 putative membrane protein [Asanoa iriomotensis]